MGEHMKRTTLAVIAQKLVAGITAALLLSSSLFPYAAFAEDGIDPQASNVTVTFGDAGSIQVPLGSALTASQIPMASNTFYTFSSGVAAGTSITATFEGWIDSYQFTTSLSAEDAHYEDVYGYIPLGIAYRKGLSVPLVGAGTVINRPMNLVKAFSINAVGYKVAFRELGNPDKDPTDPANASTVRWGYNKELYTEYYLAPIGSVITADIAKGWITKAEQQKQHAESKWMNTWNATGPGITNASNPFPVTFKAATSGPATYNFTGDLRDIGSYGNKPDPDPPTPPDPPKPPDPGPSDPDPTDPDPGVTAKEITVTGNAGVVAKGTLSGSAIPANANVVIEANKASLPDNFVSAGMRVLSQVSVKLLVNNTEVHKDFGKIQLSFPVADDQNPSEVTIFHFHQDGTMTSSTAQVKQGFATVTVEDLSTFVIGVKKAESASAIGGLAQTGDHNQLSALLVLGGVALALLVLGASSRYGRKTCLITCGQLGLFGCAAYLGRHARVDVRGLF